MKRFVKSFWHTEVSDLVEEINEYAEEFGLNIIQVSFSPVHENSQYEAMIVFEKK